MQSLIFCKKANFTLIYGLIIYEYQLTISQFHEVFDVRELDIKPDRLTDCHVVASAESQAVIHSAVVNHGW